MESNIFHGAFCHYIFNGEFTEALTNAANIAATSSYSTGHESALAAQWEKHFQLTVNEMNQEINALREECHSKNILIHVLSFWLSYEFKLIDFIKLTNDIKS